MRLKSAVFEPRETSFDIRTVDSSMLSKCNFIEECFKREGPFEYIKGIIINSEIRACCCIDHANHLSIFIQNDYYDYLEVAALIADIIRQFISHCADDSPDLNFSVLSRRSENPIYKALKVLGFDDLACFDHLTFTSLPQLNKSRSSSTKTSDRMKFFLLAGQSNMSGRGSFDDALSLSCTQFLSTFSSDEQNNEHFKKPSIIFYDPINGWQKLSDPFELHKNVDILKTVGIGPGVSFASEFARLQSTTTQEISLGLLPCAVGATSLNEWLPDFFLTNIIKIKTQKDSPVIGEKDVISVEVPICDNAGFLRVPPNALYQFGCLNLFACTLRSIFQSLHIISSMFNEVSFDGILWYQGCNDATQTREVACSYRERFEQFVRNLHESIRSIVEYVGNNSRDGFKLFLPMQLPMLTVVITATRPWMTHLEIVRNQQVSCDMMVVLSEKMEGSVYIKAIDAFGLPLKSDNVHLMAISSYHLGVCLAETLWECIKGSGTFAFQGTSYLSNRILFKETKRLEKIVIGFMDETVQESVKHYNNSDSAIKGPFPILHTGMKPSNFVYGELCFLDVCRLLKIAGVHDQDCFIDLGCGRGMCLAAARLGSFPFAAVLGIDLMISKLSECRSLMRKIDAIVHESVTSTYEIVQGNFLEIPWHHGDVILACATCFAEDQMSQITNLCRYLKAGTRIIFIDKQPFDQTAHDNLFILIGSCQVQTSWGPASGYIYKKIKT